jgi:hypothetical protein
LWSGLGLGLGVIGPILVLIIINISGIIILEVGRNIVVNVGGFIIIKLCVIIIIITIIIDIFIDISRFIVDGWGGMIHIMVRVGPDHVAVKAGQ